MQRLIRPSTKVPKQPGGGRSENSSQNGLDLNGGSNNRGPTEHILHSLPNRQYNKYSLCA